ncbi:MAG: helix-turn-helix transcriptional regulator [Acidobacteria bacterium]|nr:helix-turn-helix transcriptional regulator [Acidobacteriota bacterium]
MSHLSYGHRIQQLREKKGLSIEQMAITLDISFEWYRDIEAYDDEVVETLSIHQFIKLCGVLQVDPVELFSHPISLTSFIDTIKEHLEYHKITVSDFEEQVGWEIAEILENPSLLLKLNLTALMDLCRYTNTNWVAVLSGVSLSSETPKPNQKNNNP